MSPETRGWWPELPDDADQRDLAPGVAVDTDRVRRLDAEQRGW